MNVLQLAWNIHKKQLVEKAKKEKALGFFATRQAVVLIVTSKCNFICKHCMRDFSDVRDLPFEIAQKVVLQAKQFGFKSIALTGGEPFLYPKFEELVETIAANDYRFSLVTNGWIFKKYAEFLKKHRKRINFVAFSLESTGRKLHNFMRHEGSFDRLMEDFLICRRYKIPFHIISAISTLNYGELFDIAVFAKKQRARRLVLTTILPCPRAQENKLVLDAEKRQELFITARGIPKIIKLPVLIGADIRANSNIYLCGNFNMSEVTVDVDGNLTQCCELAGYDSESIAHAAVAVPLKDKSFGSALKIFSQHIQKVISARIDDYKCQSDLEDIDFNSCFYCVNKLGK